MQLERREDEHWHLAEANCEFGGRTLDTIAVIPASGFIYTNGNVQPIVPEENEADPVWCDTCCDVVADRYSQASDAIERWKHATSYRDIEWTPYDGDIELCTWCHSEVANLLHSPTMDAVVCEVCAALYNAPISDGEVPAEPDDEPPHADDVEPIVVIDDDANQKLAAQIDRRPYITLKSKRKYVTVTVTLGPVDYQFTDRAIAHLQQLFANYETRAMRQSDNKGGVEFEVDRNRYRRDSRPRQQIVVDGLFKDDARAFIEEVIPIVRDTTNWARDFEDASDSADQLAKLRGGQPGPATVPREGAPDLVVQEDGLARHAPLADKSISDPQIRAYVFDQAYRHGEALVDAGRIRTNHVDGHHGDTDGYEVQSNVGSTSGSRPERSSTTSVFATAHLIPASTSLARDRVAPHRSVLHLNYGVSFNFPIRLLISSTPLKSWTST